MVSAHMATLNVFCRGVRADSTRLQPTPAFGICPRVSSPRSSSCPTATPRSPNHAGREANRRLDGANGGIQRIGPRADAQGSAGLGTACQRLERRRSGCHRALARPARREPVQRNALTQAPIGVGEAFTYRIRFPDAGIYWYHPHVREDYGQEMGLYGNILVVPSRQTTGRRRIATSRSLWTTSFSRTETWRPSRGPKPLTSRWAGLVMFCCFWRSPPFDVRAGRRSRAVLPDEHCEHPGLQRRHRWRTMKVVGGDSGHCERETFVDRM